jgi:hypothetical protein
MDCDRRSCPTDVADTELLLLVIELVRCGFCGGRPELEEEEMVTLEDLEIVGDLSWQVFSFTNLPSISVILLAQSALADTGSLS